MRDCHANEALVSRWIEFAFKRSIMIQRRFRETALA